MTWTGTGRAGAEVLLGLGWDCHVWDDFRLLVYVDLYALIAVILGEPRRCQQDYCVRSCFLLERVKVQ